MAFLDLRRIGCAVLREVLRGGATLLLAGALPLSAQVATPNAAELAAGLEQFGARQIGAPGREAARDYLLEAMRRAGLEAVESRSAGEDGGENLVGTLPGSSPRRVVLAAHWGTFADARGELADAGSCAVVLAAAADLARTPRRHGLEVVLFDGERRDQGTSRAWAEALGEHPQEVLSVLVVEDAGKLAGASLTESPSTAPGVVTTLPVRRDRRWTFAPGWLVHAALQGCRTSGLGCVFADRERPGLAQLAVRTSDWSSKSDADALLRAGLPAVVLTDRDLLGRRLEGAEPSSARLEAWTYALTTTVRRLDSLPDRPRDEDRYWVFGGKVLLRRDLYWVALPLWIALVATGHRAARRKGGASSPRAFLFRMAMLVALVVLPVLSTLALLPAAIAGIFRPATFSGRRIAAGLGLLLPIWWGARLVFTTASVRSLQGWALPLSSSVVLTVALAAFVAWMFEEDPPYASVVEGRGR